MQSTQRLLSRARLILFFHFTKSPHCRYSRWISALLHLRSISSTTIIHTWLCSHWYVCVFAMKCQQSSPPVSSTLAHGRSLTSLGMCLLNLSNVACPQLAVTNNNQQCSFYTPPVLFAFCNSLVLNHTTATIPQYSSVFLIIPQYSSVFLSIPQYITVFLSISQYITVYHSILSICASYTRLWC